MKKRVVFLVLLLLGLIFFACEFNIPSAIEFKWSPNIDFVQAIPVGEKFTSIFADEVKKKQDNSQVEDMIILSCENTEIYTDVIYMELFNEILELDPDEPELPKFPNNELEEIFEDLVKDESFILDKDRNLINKFDEPMNVPFSSIGALFEGFEFTGHDIKLYVSGGSIVDRVKIDIRFDTMEDDLTVDSTDDKYFGLDPNKEESGIENWKINGYTEIEPPSTGIVLDLPLNGKDIDVYFRVYIPAGETLFLDDLTDGNIKVEIVVWLPFAFEAKEEEATISFPNDVLFDSEKDLFGRKKPGEDNMMVNIIQSLNLEIKFDENPFHESTLIVDSKGIEIVNELKDDNTFPFIVSENDMKKINAPENWPFTPNFKMKYEQGKVLRFPREFNTTEFIFSAKMKYRMDL